MTHRDAKQSQARCANLLLPFFAALFYTLALGSKCSPRALVGLGWTAKSKEDPTCTSVVGQLLKLGFFCVRSGSQRL